MYSPITQELGVRGEVKIWAQAMAELNLAFLAFHNPSLIV